jgi:hypothetical protein
MMAKFVASDSAISRPKTWTIKYVTDVKARADL